MTFYMNVVQLVIFIWCMDRCAKGEYQRALAVAVITYLLGDTLAFLYWELFLPKPQ